MSAIILMSLFLSSANAMILMAWFKKDTFVEYATLFGLSKLLSLDVYNEARQYDTELTYPKFLTSHWNNFFTRLISCPVCTATWLGWITNLIVYLAISCVTHYFWLLLIITPGGLATGYVSLYMYLQLVKLLVNE